MEKLIRKDMDSFLFNMRMRQDHIPDMNQTPAPSKKRIGMHNFGMTDECTTAPGGHSHGTRYLSMEMNSVKAFLGRGYQTETTILVTRPDNIFQ